MDIEIIMMILLIVILICNIQYYRSSNKQDKQWKMCVYWTMYLLQEYRTNTIVPQNSDIQKAIDGISDHIFWEMIKNSPEKERQKFIEEFGEIFPDKRYYTSVECDKK